MYFNFSRRRVAGKNQGARDGISSRSKVDAYNQPVFGDGLVPRASFSRWRRGSRESRSRLGLSAWTIQLRYMAFGLRGLPFPPRIAVMGRWDAMIVMMVI